MSFRQPRDADWPVILAIANASVADVPGAGSQDEWLRNRRESARERQHFVFEQNEEVVGYGAMEREPDQEASYRLFVVTAPNRRDTIGLHMVDELEARLQLARAKQSWFVEYAEDGGLTAFIRARGYAESRRFALPTGAMAIVLSKSHA